MLSAEVLLLRNKTETWVCWQHVLSHCLVWLAHGIISVFPSEIPASRRGWHHTAFPWGSTAPLASGAACKFWIPNPLKILLCKVSLGVHLMFCALPESEYFVFPYSQRTSYIFPTASKSRSLFRGMSKNVSLCFLASWPSWRGKCQSLSVLCLRQPWIQA